MDAGGSGDASTSSSPVVRQRGTRARAMSSESDHDDTDSGTQSGSDSDNDAQSEDDAPSTSRPRRRAPRRSRAPQLNDDWSKNPRTFVEPDFAPFETPGMQNIPADFDDDVTALQCFELFWTHETWNMFVTETNRQAQNIKTQKPNNYVAKKWKKVTVPEMKAFFGLRIAMEVLIHKDRYEQYWNMEENHHLTYTPGFPTVMSRDRFLAIWTMLHCVDESTVDKTDKLYKNRPLIDYLLDQFRRYYVPEQDLSLDEGMIPVKNALSIKTYIKSKPIKWGIKTFLLCESDTGYIVNAEIYTGKDNNPVMNKDLGVTGSMAARISQPYHGQYYRLYTDRFYTSIYLCEELVRGCETLMCGTILPSRKRYPKNHPSRKLEGGESEVLYNGYVAVVVWCDKKPIHFATTSHISAPGTTVPRFDPKQHKRMPRKCPKLIKEYNKKMGGTDRNDQMTRLHRCRRHHRWPRRLTIKAFMWATYNSFVIRGKLVDHAPVGKRALTFHRYVEELCMELVGDFRGRLRPLPLGRIIAARRMSQNPHLAVREPKSKHRCVVCLEKYRRARRMNPRATKPSKSVFRCQFCRVFLCISEGPRSCFVRYHSVTRYWL